MLGKKRNFEGNDKILPPQKELKINAYSSSDLTSINQQNLEKQKKEISILYNMKKSLILSCVHTKHAKYSNNKYIPCLPFSSPSSKH